MRIHVYFAADGWRWHAKARNGRIIAESGESYIQRPSCIQAARKFVRTIRDAPVLMLPYDKKGQRTEGEWLR